MNKLNIVVVVPTIRRKQIDLFRIEWDRLFVKHKIKLLVVWDGEEPYIEGLDYKDNTKIEVENNLYQEHKELIYRYTDACRNLGFIAAAKLNPDYILTLDDDVAPLVNTYQDPIQQHLDVLQKRVCIDWMNTAHDTELYLRGVPYNTRSQSPVMLSHGVWVGTPDFDGETQLRLESQGPLPYSLPYYVGPIPRRVLFPLCGMSVMVKRETLPYLYYAPMGKDTGICTTKDVDQTTGGIQTYTIPLLNRFSDIWMGISLKIKFDALGWACYTGGSTVLHTRASDAKKNFEQEKLGREWNEILGDSSKYMTNQLAKYCSVWKDKEERFNRLITSILNQG